MNQETLGHLFEPFFTTKEVGKGTGLGLATVYGILKQHDGMIEVSSEPGKGTTFRLFWPVLEAVPSTAQQATESRVSGGTETVLLVEDDEMVRRMAQEILRRAGYTVLTASDGAEALSLFEERSHEIDIAILDVVMPEMGGREAYDRMRALRPGLKSLFASGYSENAIHTNFVLDEGFTLIRKPFSRDALLHAVREALDRSPP